MADNASAVQQVLAAGVPQTFIDSQRALGKSGPLTGVNLDAQDVQKVISAYQGNMGGQTNIASQLQQQLGQVGSSQYQFDPNQYLPGIQTQAESVYAPQQAQLEAIRQLQAVSSQDTRVQTEKDFEQRMQQEVEAMNRRGAGFSGGAIRNEQDIRNQQASALLQQDLQYNAANFANLSQQAMLQAEKTQFIQDRLYNAESSAYSRWTDQRNFSLQALQTQYQVYSAERDFARNVFESDRTYEMQEEQFEQQKKEFQQTYKLNEWQFKQAKEQWDIDRKIKNLDYAQAMSNFKSKYAQANTGIGGIDPFGNDAEEAFANRYFGSSPQNEQWNIDDFLGDFAGDFEMPQSRQMTPIQQLDPFIQLQNRSIPQTI
jgi:hypothetical protein